VDKVYRPVFVRNVARVVGAGLLLSAVASGAAAQARVRPVRHERQADIRPGDQKPADGKPGDPRQGPPKGPAKWWKVYKAELKLTPEQASRIDAIFEQTFPQLRASFEELNKREQQLSSLISANDATEAQVLKQADQIESIRSELSKTRVLMLFRMRRVLSAEQREKLQQLQQEHERDGGAPPRR
jgi:Spy/CpxP family protein refolding chaperone